MKTVNIRYVSRKEAASVNANLKVKQLKSELEEADSNYEQVKKVSVVAVIWDYGGVTGTPIRHCKGYCGVVVGVWDSYKAL